MGEYTAEEYVVGFKEFHADEEHDIHVKPDGSTEVSESSDPGAWVLAWVWVSDEEARDAKRAKNR